MGEKISPAAYGETTLEQGKEEATHGLKTFPVQRSGKSNTALTERSRAQKWEGITFNFVVVVVLVGSFSTAEIILSL